MMTEDKVNQLCQILMNDDDVSYYRPEVTWTESEGKTAITVVINNDADPIDGLTMSQLDAVSELFGGNVHINTSLGGVQDGCSTCGHWAQYTRTLVIWPKPTAAKRMTWRDLVDRTDWVIRVEVVDLDKIDDVRSYCARDRDPTGLYVGAERLSDCLIFYGEDTMDCFRVGLGQADNHVDARVELFFKHTGSTT